MPVGSDRIGYLWRTNEKVIEIALTQNILNSVFSLCDFQHAKRENSMEMIIKINSVPALSTHKNVNLELPCVTLICPEEALCFWVPFPNCGLCVQVEFRRSL